VLGTAMALPVALILLCESTLMPPVTTPSLTTPPLVSVLLTTTMPAARPDRASVGDAAAKAGVAYEDLAGDTGKRKWPRVRHSDTPSIFEEGSPGWSGRPSSRTH
jgi:hypothetical protein